MPARSRAISPAPICATPSWRWRPPTSRSRTIPGCCMSRPRSARRRSAFSGRPARGTGRRSIRSPRRVADRRRSSTASPATSRPAASAITAACATSRPSRCSTVTQRALAAARLGLSARSVRRPRAHRRPTASRRARRRSRSGPRPAGRAARARCRRRSRPAARRARPRDAGGRYRRRPRRPRPRSAARPASSGCALGHARVRHARGDLARCAAARPRCPTAAPARHPRAASACASAIQFATGHSFSGRAVACSSTTSRVGRAAHQRRAIETEIDRALRRVAERRAGQHAVARDRVQRAIDAVTHVVEPATPARSRTLSRS